MEDASPARNPCECPRKGDSQLAGHLHICVFCCAAPQSCEEKDESNVSFQTCYVVPCTNALVGRHCCVRDDCNPHMRMLRCKCGEKLQFTLDSRPPQRTSSLASTGWFCARIAVQVLKCYDIDICRYIAEVPLLMPNMLVDCQARDRQKHIYHRRVELENFYYSG